MAKRSEDASETAMLKAVVHPKRRKIIEVIAGQEGGKPISPVEIAGLLDVPLTDVSYHVRVLAECKAITLTGTKPARGSRQHFYRPSPKFMALPWVPLILGAASQATVTAEAA